MWKTKELGHEEGSSNEKTPEKLENSDSQKK